MVIGAVAGAGTAVAVNKMNKPKIPDTPEAPKTLPNGEIDAQAKARSMRAEKQSMGAFGRTDTLLTGPGGIGVINPAQDKVKTANTLLGQ